MRDPLSYQIAPTEWVKTRRHPLLALDKRLGKCFVSIRWALHHKAKNSLVVAPRSACPGWLDELEADGLMGMLWEDIISRKGYSPGSFDHLVESTAEDDQPLFFITNPEALFRSSGRSGSKQPQPYDICMFDWDAIIWDEISNLRNPKTQLSQVVRACFSDIPLKLGLSGDPAPEGELGLFGIYHFLQGQFMGHRNFYGWRHDHFQKVGYEWVPKPGHLTLIKNEHDRLSYRETQVGAGFRITKTTDNLYCYLPPKVRKAYDDVEMYMELPNESGISETNYPIVALNWLRRLTGGCPDEPGLQHGAKLDLLEEILLGDLRKTQAVITFAYNSELRAAEGRVLDLISAGKLSGRFASVTGETNVHERRLIGKAFQSRRINWLLMQIKVAKFGIDLSAADTMVRYSQTYSYEDWSQSMERIVHPKKSGILRYVNMVARDTVDEDISKTLAEKKLIARLFMSATLNRTKERLRKKLSQLRNVG
jgi:hypothetical protein